jgi:mannan endo-1,4-beta-mannosidase
MWAKIAVGLATPVLSGVLVAGLLITTHHTVVPPLALPSVSSATVTSSSGRNASATKNNCRGQVSKHFAGIAVQRGIARTVSSFAQDTARRPQVVEFYNPFRNPFAAGEAQTVVRTGAIPLIQLNPTGTPASEIAAGKYDQQLRAYAAAVKKFACAIILSFGHEMNGWWYRWGYPRTSAAEYIAAWRHIHDVFARAGVGNVTWSWDPSHQYREAGVGKIATPASDWYPGNNYVDIIGLDGYLGYDHNGQPQNFKEVFSFQLRDIRRIAPDKLVYLAETGVAPGPAAKQQITNLFAGLAGYHLAGLVWFDAIGQPDATGKPKDYRLQHQPEMAKTYAKLLSAFLE